MSQMLARVNCPSCKQPFSMPVEQILDAEVDPSARGRLLAGQVNLAVCPHCRTMGLLNLPFLYYDPTKELALVFMPMEAGRSDLERQQVIGTLTRTLMNDLPPELRRGYLLNPQVFFTYDSIIKRVMEAEGITQEMLDAQRKRAELLQRLLDASPEEAVALAHQEETSIDEAFFQQMTFYIAQWEAAGQEEIVRRLSDLRVMLLEHTAAGRRLKARAAAFHELRAEPTREKLLELLLRTDREGRAALVAMARPLLDYFFFQLITQRIEASADAAERTRLEALRKEVMEYRQEIEAQARQVVEDKEALLRDLFVTEKPELLARRRVADLDELFFGLLKAHIESAQEDGDDAFLARWKEIWEITTRLLQEAIPPELLLVTQLLETEDEGERRRLLEQNRKILTPALIEMMEQTEADLRERGDEEAARRMATAVAAARIMASAA